MKATVTEYVNGLPEDREVKRLDEGDREQAINDFVWARLGTDCSDDDFDSLAIGCTILYRDDYDAGTSEYQVVDAEGHGDGSGAWYPVK